MQLMMWRGNIDVSPVKLPEGFSLRSYKGEEDIPKWVHITKHGLQESIKTVDDFNTHMLSMEGVKPECIFFVDFNSESVATITAVIYPENKQGYVHMVAALPSVRGLGIGNELVNVALNVFCENNLLSSTLTTDDFRIPAIKSYFKAGFLPVLHRNDMEERWRKVLIECNVPSMDAVDCEGNFIKRIYSI